ncbi:MAG: methylenetetrahydrofolate reductase [Brachybacterium tyrofermentans]
MTSQPWRPPRPEAGARWRAADVSGDEPKRRAEPWPEALVRGTRFEVIPVPGIVAEVAAHLPPGTRVSVTASRKQGLDATVAAAGALSERGFVAIPHLAARQIVDEAELQRILDDLASSGVQELFVIAGDAPHPAGDFEGSLHLLEAMGTSGRSFEIGVGAYPEGHPFAPSEAESMRLLQEKARYASVLVTQLCFDAGALLDWVRLLREHGVRTPVRPGIAGPTDAARLLRIGARVGVGPSLRLLTRQGSGIRHLLGPGGWSPDTLLEELVPAFADPRYGLEGLHVYTFNAVEASADWWRGGDGTEVVIR